MKIKLDLGEEVDAALYFNEKLPITGEIVEHIASGVSHDSRVAPLRRAKLTVHLY